MRFKAISIALLLLTPFVGQAQQWDRYIPEKQRKSIVNKARQVSGAGAAIATGSFMLVYWITDPVARALVSDAIDGERITNEEADALYRKLRPEKAYRFLVEVRTNSTPPHRSSSASSLGDPLAQRQAFLQRADNRNVFAKGEVADHKIDYHFGSIFKPGELRSTYEVIFSQADRSGSLVVRDLADKIEIQFTMRGKKVSLDYKVKDLVSRLEDL